MLDYQSCVKNDNNHFHHPFTHLKGPRRPSLLPRLQHTPNKRRPTYITFYSFITPA